MLGYDTRSFGVTNLLHKSSLNRTWLITPVNHKLLSETPGYDTLSLGVTNLLHKSSLKMTEPIPAYLKRYCHKHQDTAPSPFGEGWGEAS